MSPDSVVVEHQMDVQLRGHIRLDLPQKAEKLPWCRWEGWQSVSISPPAMSRAANNVVVLLGGLLLKQGAGMLYVGHVEVAAPLSALRILDVVPVDAHTLAVPQGNRQPHGGDGKLSEKPAT